MTTPRIAIDTGGTFTDLVARAPDGAITRLKVPSTPDDPGRAVLAALTALAERGGPTGAVRHGTTVATNALLERRGARVVGITTAGFEDLLRLRRQARPDLYALHPVVPPPLVPRLLGIRGRRDPSGAVIEPLEDVEAWVARHHDALAEAEAFAVCLLHGYGEGADERAIASALAAVFPAVPISTGHALAPVFREYERASTVTVNAFLAPVMSRYLTRLDGAIAGAMADGMSGGGESFTVMGSAGGLLTAAEAARAPVHTVLSGPAGGVRGAYAAGRRAGRDALLTLDMGGTSTDVSVVRGVLAPEDDGQLGDHPLRVPLLPIETVGAGGGSIAYVDDGGALRVGPRSAGAVPGPACYGRAGPDAEATVTDAHVVLGRVEALLGGAFALDVDAARAAVGRLAETLDAGLEETAEAMLAVAEATMARACKRVTMDRGTDPRALTLVAFGGAGGLHACGLADALGCRDVLFPAGAGVLSADGIVDAPREASATRTVLWREAEWRDDRLAALWASLRGALAEALPGGDGWQALVDCRYVGQTHPLTLALDAPPTAEGLRAAFDRLHDARYGYALPPERPAELVALRMFLRRDGIEYDDTDAIDAIGGPPEAIGPSTIATYDATLYLPAGWRCHRLPSGDRLCTRLDGMQRAAGVRLELALEIHRQRMAAIAEEMGATLMRAAFSANIKERRDFSCAVFDAEGQMLCHAAHIPVHLGSTPLSVRAAIEAVEMKPGVQVLLNDPYAGGTHLPDVTLVTPVFVGEATRPAYYVANRAHHADIGGISAGSLPAPRDAAGNVRHLTIDDEGIRLPPMVLDDALRARFAAASRLADERVGDLRAQEAANRLGARRVVELVEALGADAARLDAALIDYAERRMRAVLAALPDGTRTFVDHLDDDGVDDTPIAVPVTLTVAGDTATVDLTAAPDAVDGPLNAPRAIAVSAVFYVFRCLAGDSLPANAGLLRPITIRTRPGSIVDPHPPAAVSAGNVETSQRLVDALLGALAAFAPDRIPAAACGSMNNVLFGGTRADGGGFVHYETLAGGGGGGPLGAGADAIHVHMTNTLNTPIEALERDYPVRIERYAVREKPAVDDGISPGGAGVVRRYRFLAPAEVTLMTERRRRGAYGLGGAPDGVRGRNRHLPAKGEAVELPGKVTVAVEAGDAIEVATPGGGGHRAR